MKKIGVIADTHGFLDEAAPRIFEGADLILHAGDVGAVRVIRELERIAPVVAVNGNHEDEDTEQLPWIETVTVKEAKIALTHRFFPLNMENVINMPPGWQSIMGVENVRAMVFGHGHEPLCARNEGLLYFNPGYSGPDLTEPVRTVGVLEVSGSEIEAGVYFLNPPPRPEYLNLAEFYFGEGPKG